VTSDGYHASATTNVIDIRKARRLEQNMVKYGGKEKGKDLRKMWLESVSGASARVLSRVNYQRYCYQKG
jgi:hypothetical protein